MNILKIAGSAIKATCNSGILTFRKFSPEILIGGSIILGLGSTVLACIATTKIEAEIAKTSEELSALETVQNDPTMPTMPFKEYRKKIFLIRSKGVVRLITLFAPAAGCAIGSAACALGSNKILRTRNVALVAAYKTLDGAFKTYRKRVVEEYGEDKDRQFRTGVREKTVTNTTYDPEGNVLAETEQKVEYVDPTACGPYGKVFDHTNPDYCDDMLHTLRFLARVQNFWNDKFKTAKSQNGVLHVVLNEVYETLNFPHTNDGMVTGWIYDPNQSTADTYIDFGIFDMDCRPRITYKDGDPIHLNFNVQGLIHGQI